MKIDNEYLNSHNLINNRNENHQKIEKIKESSNNLSNKVQMKRDSFNINEKTRRNFNMRNLKSQEYYNQRKEEFLNQLQEKNNVLENISDEMLNFIKNISNSKNNNDYEENIQKFKNQAKNIAKMIHIFEKHYDADNSENLLSNEFNSIDFKNLSEVFKVAGKSFDMIEKEISKILDEINRINGEMDSMLDKDYFKKLNQMKEVLYDMLSSKKFDAKSIEIKTDYKEIQKI
ncbi:hypothetical protein WG909_05040 [Peptostreptococcaceae bacterium AGR-M142]